jgi:uncharacterized protein Veg
MINPVILQIKTRINRHFGKVVVLLAIELKANDKGLKRTINI